MLTHEQGVRRSLGMAAALAAGLLTLLGGAAGAADAAGPRYAYVSNAAGGSVSIIALNEVAISPDGQRAYAVGPVADLVFVIDVQSRQVVGSVKSNRNAHGVAVSRDGREVWTADWGGTLTVIDAASLKVKDTIELGGRPNHIAFSADGGKVYVTRTGEDPKAGEVVVLDAASRRPISSLRVGKGPHEISLEVYVVASGSLPSPAGAGAASAGASADGSRGAAAKDAGAGGISVQASLASRDYLASKGQPQDLWGFLVNIDTHSVDLSGIDLVTAATLRDGKGNTFKPTGWRPLSEDSHHGCCSFRRTKPACRHRRAS